MSDASTTEDNTQIRKIKSENELDQIDDSILDQVSGGRKTTNDKAEQVEYQPIVPAFDPTSIFE